MNFTISELCMSNKARELKINNIPTDMQTMDNLFYLITECLQPLRDKLKRPIIITSGYRNAQINKLVGGVANSGHVRGTSADITVSGMSAQDLFNFIVKSGQKFTQLIEEHASGITWVHIEYDRKNLKNEKLKYISGVYSRI